MVLCTECRHCSYMSETLNKNGWFCKTSRLSNHGSVSAPFVVFAAAHALQRQQVCRMISKSNSQQCHCTRSSGAVALPPGDNMQIAYPLDAVNHWHTCGSKFSVADTHSSGPYDRQPELVDFHTPEHMQSACIIPFDVPSRSGKLSRSTLFPPSQLHRDTQTKWCNIQLWGFD